MKPNLREMMYTLSEYDEETDTNSDFSFAVPALLAICPCCEGHGQVDNPAFSNGITESDREDMGEDAFQSYMDGVYDVPCTNCHSTGKVQVPNVQQCTYEQKRLLVQVRREQRATDEYEREQVAMHRAECWYMY